MIRICRFPPTQEHEKEEGEGEKERGREGGSHLSQRTESQGSERRREGGREGCSLVLVSLVKKSRTTWLERSF